MENDYQICAGCSRHIKAVESTCPFCGEAAGGPTVSRRPPRRMSRGLWAAIGSSVVPLGTAVVACHESDTTPTVDAAAVSDAPRASDVDDDDAPRADARTCSAPNDPDDGGALIECGESRCNRATEYCEVVQWRFCRDYGEPPKLTYACVGKGAGVFPDACLSCAACDCIQPYISARDTDDPIWGSTSWSCAKANGGGIEIFKDVVSCNSCYGSPPARRTLA